MAERGRGWPSSLGRPPSMKDVAELAGVSHQTVSRVLNGSGAVSQATRERILAVIEDVGYRRNTVARALVTRRSGILGVIAPTSVDYGPASILLAVELSARGAGYFTSVAPLSTHSRDSLTDAVDHMLGQRVEGIVLIEPIEGVVEDLARIRVPPTVPVLAVACAPVGRGTGLATAGVDQVSGSRQAVEHLLGLGHCDIACLAGPPTWFEAQERAQTYRAVMEGEGLAARVHEAGGWAAADGYRAGRELLEGGVPTAVVTGNDELALGLMRALEERGLDVPVDVSVVGFDDIPAAAFLRPALTTVRQDFARLGHEVIALMDRAVSTSTPVESVLIPAELVVRHSTAAPARPSAAAPERPSAQAPRS